MTPEESLLAYLYPRLVEALQTWKGFNDIYGIWIVLALFEDEPTKPSFSHVMPLRHSVATPERINSYFGYPYSPGVADYTVGLSFEYCSDPWPSLEERGPYDDEDSYIEGNPEGLALREAFFSWKRTQPEYVASTDPYSQVDNPELVAFLDLCGKLIRRLHNDNVLTALFQKSVPVGLCFSNDVDERITVPATQDNNPLGLADGMLAWMRSEG